MRIEFRNSSINVEGPTPRIGDKVDHGGQEFIVKEVYWYVYDHDKTIRPVVVLEIFSASAEENLSPGSETGVEKAALRKIAGGYIDNAVERVLAGDWKWMFEQAQRIAQEALNVR